MKPAQWAVAAVVLAAMVFVITFAMNYLGGPAAFVGPTHQTPKLEKTLALKFLNSQDVPPSIMVKNKDGKNTSLPVLPAIESEVRVRGHHDFWFTNPHDSEVLLGVKSKNCRCSGVEVFLVPQQYQPAYAAPASLICVSAGGGLLSAVGNLDYPAFRASKDVKGVELLNTNDTVKVPPAGMGWIRLHWKGETAGPQKLNAEVWMSDREVGPSSTFTVSVMHHEPIRVRSDLDFGTLNEQSVGKGVTPHIYVWSSTRRHFELKAQPVTVRNGDPASDPFVVGTPIPLTEEELRERAEENNRGITSSASTFGSVLSGYKVPVTILATSPDGKVPVDIGPFRRGVLISSPDADTANGQVVATFGRVRGLVDLGSEDVGNITFGPFPSRKGARATPLQLVSSEKGLKLDLDTQRTPKYLTATLDGPKPLGESRLTWTLRARVLPGQVRGPFPRDKDPLYEDSAIYLSATLKDKGKTVTRPIRIAVSGTANES